MNKTHTSTIWFVLTLIFTTGCATTGSFIPTPEKAISMRMGADPVKWNIDYADGSPQVIILEFVPEGQQIQDWKEMVSQQINFTDLTLADHIDAWKRMITQVDPNVSLSEVLSDSDSQTVSYRSEVFNEFAMRRFIKGPDGIYAIAYHVRLNLLDEDRLELWSDIIATSELVQNPKSR